MTTDEVIAYAHECRDTPYPSHIDNTALVCVLKGVLDNILVGNIGQSITGLASLVDTLENIKTH